MHGAREEGKDDSLAGPLPGPVALDANALDADGPERSALVSRFRRLADAGAMVVVAAGGVRREIEHPQTPLAVREAVPDRPAFPQRPLSHAQKLDRIRVRAILRGDAPAGKHEADALHLSEAAEAGCAVFITHDRRILRRRGDLRAVLPALRIMTLERYMALVEEGDEPPADTSERAW